MNQKIKTVLDKLAKQAELEKTRQVDVLPQNRMLAITADTGKFFNILLRAMQAKKILEIGTSTGYSTLWLADAILDNHGHITTIEQNNSKVIRAKKNFEEAEIDNVIDIKNGAALDIIRTLDISEKFDFVFLDADKENVIEYFDLVLPLTRVGGIIATDNMLYPEKYRDQMKKLSDHIKKLPNVKTVTLSIGNGEELSVKTS